LHSLELQGFAMLDYKAIPMLVSLERLESDLSHLNPETIVQIMLGSSTDYGRCERPCKKGCIFFACISSSSPSGYV